MALFDWTPAMQFENASGLDGITAALAGYFAGPGGQQAASALTGSGKQGTDTASIFNALGGIFSGGGMPTGSSGSSDPLGQLISSLGAGGSGGGTAGTGGMDLTSVLKMFGGGSSSGGSFGAGDLGGVLNSIFNLTGQNATKPVTWNNWDPKLLSLLQGAAGQITPDLANTTKDYNKGQAIADATGVVDAIFQNFQKQIPTIFSNQQGRGAFNSTATKGLVDQAQGEAVAKASQAVLDNIKSYAAIRQGDVSALSQMLGQGRGSITGEVPKGGSGNGGNMGGDIAGIINAGVKLFGM